MNRRSFLQSILAAGVAPAVIGSGILMPVRQIQRVPAWFRGEPQFLDNVCGFGLSAHDDLIDSWSYFLRVYGPDEHLHGIPLIL